MKDKVYGVRMEIQLYEELEGEAKNLGQSVASLIRNFIRNGLSGFNSDFGERSKSEDRVESLLKTIEILAGANLHLTAEIRALVERKRKDESDSDLNTRVQAEFSNYVRNSYPRGLAIAKEVREFEETLKNRK